MQREDDRPDLEVTHCQPLAARSSFSTLLFLLVSQLLPFLPHYSIVPGIMDLAQQLIRVTARSFYSVKQILIIDALIIHSVLATDDFAYLLGSQAKDVRRLLHPLKQARLISTHARQETRVDYQKAVSREYYYIPLHPAVDAIKYKVWKLQNKVQELYKPSEERKEWKCPQCKREWTDLEVLDNSGPEGFLCHKCGHVLDRAETATGNAKAVAGHEKQARLQAQIEKMVNLMRQIDSQDIPENDFDSAWERKKDVPRDEGTGIRREMVPLKVAKAGRGGVEQTDASKLNINISTGDALDDAERAEAERKKAAALAQNQLPVWHTTSAIGLIPDIKGDEAGQASLGIVKSDPDATNGDTKPVIDTMDEEMAAVYAEMERERQRDAERAAIAAEEAEEEDDDEDEGDDDDFEDIPSTNMGTPLPDATPIPSAQPAATNGVKRERETDAGFESGTSSSVNTPAGTASSIDRDSKRLKLENGQGAGKATSASVKQDEASDSDEDEGDFEDAM